MGASSGASMAAHVPLAGSWISAPILSDRQRKTWIWAVIGMPCSRYVGLSWDLRTGKPVLTGPDPPRWVDTTTSSGPMSIDITDLRGFYASPLGGVTRRFVNRAVGRFWGNLTGLRVLGLGYAPPLSVDGPNRERADAGLHAVEPGCRELARHRPLGLGPRRPPVDAAAGCVHRPGASRPCARDGREPSELLHEIWRILTPGGRIIMVAPNRRGLWARMDTTPFGYGQPYSRSQLKALMRQTWFSPEGWAETLYVPPLRNRLLLQTAQAWSRSASASRSPSRAFTWSMPRSSSIVPARSGRFAHPEGGRRSSRPPPLRRRGLLFRSRHGRRFRALS